MNYNLCIDQHLYTKKNLLKMPKFAHHFKTYKQTNFYRNVKVHASINIYAKTTIKNQNIHIYGKFTHKKIKKNLKRYAFIQILCI